MVMLTTAGVICLRSGASEDVPLACSSIGSGTLALAHTAAAVTARPNAAIPSSSLIAVIFHWGSRARFFVLFGVIKAGPSPGAGLSDVRDFDYYCPRPQSRFSSKRTLRSGSVPIYAPEGLYTLVYTP